MMMTVEEVEREVSRVMVSDDPCSELMDLIDMLGGDTEEGVPMTMTIERPIRVVRIRNIR